MNDSSVSFDNAWHTDPPPRAPLEPGANECCGNGCDPCVIDLYEEARQQYREALAKWCERHPGVDPALVRL